MYTLDIKGVNYDVVYDESNVHETVDINDTSKTRYIISDDFVIAKRINFMTDVPEGTIPPIEHAAVIHIDTDGIIAESAEAALNSDHIDLKEIIDRIEFPDEIDANKITNITIGINAYDGNTKDYTANPVCVYCSDNYFTDTGHGIVCKMN